MLKIQAPRSHKHSQVKHDLAGAELASRELRALKVLARTSTKSPTTSSPSSYPEWDKTRTPSSTPTQSPAWIVPTTRPIDVASCKARCGGVRTLAFRAH